MTTDELRAKFEAWYIENAFNYESNPLGSRECGLQWKAWQAAHASRDAEVEALKWDAERYRWLRELDGGAIYHLLGACDGIYQEKVDAAIDAAMAKESGE